MASPAVADPPSPEASERIRAALASADRIVQAGRIAPLLESLEPGATSDLAEVYESAFETGLGGGIALEIFVERLAAGDPLRARDRIALWPADRQREAYPALIRAWARQDPGGAFESVNEPGSPETRKASFAALIEGWSEVASPESIWRFLNTQPDLDRELGAQVVLRSRMLRVGAEQMLREVAELPEEFADFEVKLLRTAVGLAARSQPRAAIAVVEAHGDEPLRDSLMRRVATNWVTQEPAAAMAWLRAQPASEVRGRVIREAYRTWVVRDRSAATAWMAEQRQLGDLGTILDIYATALARSDPRAAVAWASDIEDPQRRREALVDIGIVWHHEDPEAAGIWLREAGLEQDVERYRQRRRARVRDTGLGRADAGEKPVSGRE